MRVGQARKRDANEKAIVDALRAFGATIFRLSGEGVPDLLVGYRGTWMPLEVKSEKGVFTQLQREAMTNGSMAALVVRSVDEALAAIGVK